MSESKRAAKRVHNTKERIYDADFDKLVVEASGKIAEAQLVETSGSQPKEEHRDPAQKINWCNRQNQPKRPMNAFMVWGQAVRRELHKRFSNVQNAQLSKALGRVWGAFSTEQKEPFVNRANEIRARHKREYPNYRYQPRRLQERRGRGAMLIGINLDTPVNQSVRYINSVQDDVPGRAHNLNDHSRIAHHSEVIDNQNRFHGNINSLVQTGTNYDEGAPGSFEYSTRSRPVAMSNAYSIDIVPRYDMRQLSVEPSSIHGGCRIGQSESRFRSNLQVNNPRPNLVPQHQHHHYHQQSTSDLNPTQYQQTSYQLAPEQDFSQQRAHLTTSQGTSYHTTFSAPTSCLDARTYESNKRIVTKTFESAAYYHEFSNHLN